MKLQLLSRPLPNAHWVLPVVIITAWEMMLLGGTCTNSIEKGLPTLAIATALIVFWVSDLQTNQFPGWPRAARVVVTAAYNLANLTLITILIAIPIAAISPTVDCYTDRAYVTESLSQVSKYKTVIAENALRARTVDGSGNGVAFSAEKPVSGGYISSNGTIVLEMRRPTALLVLKPSLEDSKVKWACSGFPIEILPSVCRTLPKL